MAESLLQELQRYVQFGPEDEAALRALHPIAQPHFQRISDLFYDRILNHDEARRALEGGEATVGRLRHTLVRWLEGTIAGPWDEAYFELRCRIGRMHVRISLPQHYMFAAMNVLRQELLGIVDATWASGTPEHTSTRSAVEKCLDIELAIMLHTYREDMEAQQARAERLATYGQLVGSIGHELRNPLGVMETSLYILRNRVGDDERARRHLDRIGEQLNLANTIITDLLDLIRDRPLQREQVPLADILASAVGDLTRPAGLALELPDPATLPAVSGDATQLRQVLVNLLQNAIDAAGDDGRVRVECAAGAGQVEFAVEDSGPGVDPTVRRRLFEPLVTTKVKGIGLGLALVKRIVERHGGNIAYVPKPGSGARFLVRLPA